MPPRCVVAVVAFLSACSGVPREEPAPPAPPSPPAPPPVAATSAESKGDAPPAAKGPPAPAFTGWSGPAPQWIWSSAQPRGDEVVLLERAFDVPRPIARASLRAAADNRLRVYLNGELVGADDEWEHGMYADVGADVRRGENVIALVAANGGGEAGAWAELVVEDASSKRVRVVTDATWTAASLPAGADFARATPANADRARSGPAHAFGAFGVAPWTKGSAGPQDAAKPAPEADLGHALAPSAIQVPDGFRVELVHEVPRSSEGSWVTLGEDPRGRLYTSDQHGRLFRVTPSAIGAVASTTRVEPVAVDLGSAHGLCWAFDALYVVVSERDPGRVPGLYRLRDTDGDDALDAVELLRELEGSGEHGPHAIRLGPDGALWLMAGNHTDLTEFASSRVPRTWAEDSLLPTIDDPNGHAVGRMAPGGWLARTDRDGARWELYSAGYRNAYDFAFGPQGEPFTFDSDMEWDVGAPWYRPTRILHAASGTEFAWRGGSGNGPTDLIDTWPSVCDLDRGSPTGVEFGTNARFPAKWRKALYACDWTYGTIHAVHLEADGASWRAKSEVFAKAEPFQVTDAHVARDGALYVTTGGRNTRSALYRISWAGPLDAAAEKPERATVVQKRRLELEALHAPARRTPEQLDAIVRGLVSEDAFLSGAARVALEHTPADQWQTVWERGADDRSRSVIVVAALHTGNLDDATVLGGVSALLASAPERTASGAFHREMSLEDLRLVELALLRRKPDAAWRDDVAARVLGHFPAVEPRLARESAVVLAGLDAPGSIEPLLARIDASRTQEDAIHYAYCLRAVRTGWTPDLRTRFLDFLDGRARTFRGGVSLEQFVGRIREDFVARIPEAERAAIAARIAPPSKPAAAVVAPAVFVRRWTRAELDELLARPAAPRSFEKGRDAFARATCVACHRVGDAGGATGPDLTTTSARFGIADVLDALLEPSKTISDQYRDVEIRTMDGDLLVGRVESEKDGVVRLRRTPGDDVYDVAEQDVEMRRPYPLSRMPSGLLDALDEEGVLDLFAYLKSGGAADHAVYRR